MEKLKEINPMVTIKESAITRKNAKVTIVQRENDVILTNENSGQFTTIPNELLPDLSGLLGYISGYTIVNDHSPF